MENIDVQSLTGPMCSISYLTKASEGKQKPPTTKSGGGLSVLRSGCWFWGCGFCWGWSWCRRWSSLATLTLHQVNNHRNDYNNTKDKDFLVHIKISYITTFFSTFWK